MDHAKIILDACKERNVSHVILCSSNICETGPKEARHLGTKLEMETYLKNDSGIECLTILRPASFFENYDDPVNMNPNPQLDLTHHYNQASITTVARSLLVIDYCLLLILFLGKFQRHQII